MLGNRKDADDLPCLFRWHGVEDPLGLADECEDLIDKLLYGPRHGLNLEKLAGYRHLYSARKNNGDRLLFTTIEKNNKRTLTVCEFVPSHAYHKAKMFKPGVLENFREMHGQRLSAETIEDKHFVKITEEELNLPVHTNKRKQEDKTRARYQTKRVEFFLQKFIALDDKQSVAVKSEYEDDLKATVITGAAGSGKTCIAATLIGEKVERECRRAAREGTPMKPVLYVAESEELCKLVERNWLLSPLAEKYVNGEVQIKTYEKMMQEVELAADHPVPKEKAGEAHFQAFIATSIANARANKVVKQSLGEAFLADKEIMYKELRIISGYQSFEDYRQLAGTQSLLSSDVQKEWLYHEAHAYKKELEKNHLIDYALYQPTAESCYAFIIPDEAQDFSWGQLIALLRLTVKIKDYPQICFLEDEQQGLVDLLPKLSFLKSQLEAKLGHMNFIELNIGYRCPPAIVNVANAFLSMGSKLSNRRAKYMEPAPELEQTGTVELFTEFTDELRSALCQSPPPPGFAVITTEALKQKAMALFGEVVYTTKEIKGLEFKHIVWFGLMSDKIFYRANKCWQAAKNKEPVANPLEFAPAYHTLYTACTRATERLTIIEDNPESSHKLKEILSELRSVIARNSKEKQSSPNVKPAGTEAMDIMNQIRTFILAGRTEKAHLFGAAHHIAAAEIDNMIADLTIVKGPSAKASTPAVTAKLSTSTATMHGQPKKGTATPTAPVKTAAKVVKGYSKNDLEKLISSQTVDRAAILAVLNHKNAVDFVFKTPLFAEGESFFTLMFDKSETRKIIMDELPARFDTFLPYFTTTDLCRKVKRNKQNQLKIIPAMCMAQQPGILKCMSRDNKKVLRIWCLIDEDTLVTPIHMANTMLHETFMLFWIVYNDTSHVVLTHLLNLKRLSKLTASQFVQIFHISPVSSTSLFWCLLQRGDKGYRIANEILAQNKHLAADISVATLHFYDYAGDNQPAAIEQLNNSVDGKKLICTMETMNLRLASFSFSTLTSAQARQLHKQVRPKAINTEQKYKVLEGIILTFNTELDRSRRLAATQVRESVASKLAAIKYLREALQNLIAEQPNEAHIYFFQLALASKNPVLDQQCWFYQLMYNPDTRPLMYLLLAHEKFGAYLLQHMPINSLCGTRMKDPTSISPFMWMATSRERLALLRSIIQPDSLATHLIPIGVLGKLIIPSLYAMSEFSKYYCAPQFRAEPSPNQPIAFSTLLLLTPEGRDILITLCANKREIAQLFPPHHLVETMLIVSEEKRLTPLIAELLLQPEYEKLLLLILSQYSSQYKLLLTDMLFSCFFDEYQDDLNALVRLESMLKHENTIAFLRVHFKAFSQIALRFNPIYFVSEEILKATGCSKMKSTPQSELIRLMKSTEAGTVLFTTIQEVITDNLSSIAKAQVSKLFPSH